MFNQNKTSSLLRISFGLLTVTFCGSAMADPVTLVTLAVSALAPTWVSLAFVATVPVIGGRSIRCAGEAL